MKMNLTDAINLALEDGTEKHLELITSEIAGFCGVKYSKFRIESELYNLCAAAKVRKNGEEYSTINPENNVNIIPYGGVDEWMQKLKEGGKSNKEAAIEIHAFLKSDRYQSKSHKIAAMIRYWENQGLRFKQNPTVDGFEIYIPAIPDALPKDEMPPHTVKLASVVGPLKSVTPAREESTKSGIPPTTTAKTTLVPCGKCSAMVRPNKLAKHLRQVHGAKSWVTRLQSSYSGRGSIDSGWVPHKKTGGHEAPEMQQGFTRCRGCGRPAMPGSDRCYSCE